jgi:hypothetical protein
MTIHLRLLSLMTFKVTVNRRMSGFDSVPCRHGKLSITRLVEAIFTTTPTCQRLSSLRNYAAFYGSRYGRNLRITLAAMGLIGCNALVLLALASRCLVLMYKVAICHPST